MLRGVQCESEAVKHWSWLRLSHPFTAIGGHGSEFRSASGLKGMGDDNGDVED